MKSLSTVISVMFSFATILNSLLFFMEVEYAKLEYSILSMILCFISWNIRSILTKKGPISE